MKFQIILLSSFILINFLHTVSTFPTPTSAHNQSTSTTPDSDEDDESYVDNFDDWSSFDGLQEVAAAMGKQADTTRVVELAKNGGNTVTPSTSYFDLVNGNDTQGSSPFNKPIPPNSAKCAKLSRSEKEDCMKYWTSQMDNFQEAMEKYSKNLYKLTEGGNEIWTSNGYSVRSNGSNEMPVDYDGNSVFRLKVSIGQHNEIIEDLFGKKIVWQISYPSNEIIWIALKVPDNIEASSLQSEVTDNYIQVAASHKHRNHSVKTTDSNQQQQPKVKDVTITVDSNDKHHNSGALTSATPMMSFIVSFAVLIN